MTVHRIVVDVMLKPEILDPQGQAVANALPNLGFATPVALRIGRHVELCAAYIYERDIACALAHPYYTVGARRRQAWDRHEREGRHHGLARAAGHPRDERS